MHTYTKEQIMRYIELLLKLESLDYEVAVKIEQAVQSLHDSFEFDGPTETSVNASVVDGGEKPSSTIAKDIIKALKNGGKSQ